MLGMLMAQNSKPALCLTQTIGLQVYTRDILLRIKQ
jgi:hypothetical protein